MQKSKKKLENMGLCMEKILKGVEFECPRYVHVIFWFSGIIS